MLAKIAGFIRGLVAPNFNEGREDVQLQLNNRGAQLVAQELPELTEIVRLGNTWTIVSTTGQAALTALPTTVAGFTVANTNERSKSLIIESFGSWEAVVDATQTDVTAIFAMMHKLSSAAPSGGTAENVWRSHVGKSGYSGVATTGRGMTVANDGWNPHETLGSMAAAAAGANWKVNEVRARGLYIVPPGGSFSVQAVKAAAAAALQQFFFIRLHEAILPIAT